MTVMQMDEFFTNGQTQAGGFFTSRRPGRQSLKFFEQQLLVLFRKARPFIEDRKPDRIFEPLGRYQNIGIRWREFHGVSNEISHYLSDGVGIKRNCRNISRIEMDPDFLFICQYFFLQRKC